MKILGFLVILVSISACSSKKRIGADPSQILKGEISKPGSPAGGNAEGATNGGVVLDGQVTLYSAQEAKDSGLDLENLVLEPGADRDQRLSAGTRDTFKFRVSGKFEMERLEVHNRRVDRVEKDEISLSEIRTLSVNKKEAQYRIMSRCKLNKRQKTFDCSSDDEFIDGDFDSFKVRKANPCEFHPNRDGEPLFTIAGARFETNETKRVFLRAIVRRKLEEGTLACKDVKPAAVVQEEVIVETDEEAEPTRPLEGVRKVIATVTIARDSETQEILSARVLELQ